MDFVTSGKVDFIVIPNDVTTPSKTAMGRADADTDVLHLSEFLEQLHLSDDVLEALKTKKPNENAGNKSSHTKSTNNVHKKPSKKSLKKRCKATTKEHVQCKGNAINVGGVTLYCSVHHPK